MKNYIEISWDEFISKYSPFEDHVHISVLIVKSKTRNESGIGVKDFDPIILVPNEPENEKTRKAINKFPGTSFKEEFVKNALARTQYLLKLLKDFSYGPGQYEFVINFFNSQDAWLEQVVIKDNLKSNLFYFFRKALIIATLEKTGYFIDIYNKPFYIDEVENEEDPSKKSFRLFFEAKLCKQPPFLGSAHKFLELRDKKKVGEEGTVKDLSSYDSRLILDFIEGKTKTLKEHAFQILLGSYRKPLAKFLKMKST